MDSSQVYEAVRKCSYAACRHRPSPFTGGDAGVINPDEVWWGASHHPGWEQLLDGSRVSHPHILVLEWLCRPAGLQASTDLALLSFLAIIPVHSLQRYLQVFGDSNHFLPQHHQFLQCQVIQSNYRLHLIQQSSPPPPPNQDRRTYY